MTTSRDELLAAGETRILVVDDDEAYRQTLSRMLARAGFEALSTGSLDEALKHVAAGVTHVVLDLRLDEDNGLDWLAPMLARNAALQVLVLTGYASIATAVSAVKMGAVNYLGKPASVDAILEALGLVEAGAPQAAGEGETAASPRRVEWEYIQMVLERNNGNISATARELNMHRRTLQRKLNKRPAA